MNESMLLREFKRCKKEPRTYIYLYINIWRMKFSHLFPFLSHVWSEIPYEPFSPSVRRSVGWLVCHVFLKGRRDSLPMLLSELLLQLSVRLGIRVLLTSLLFRKKLADYDVNYVAKSKKDRKKWRQQWCANTNCFLSSHSCLSKFLLSFVPC